MLCLTVNTFWIKKKASAYVIDSMIITSALLMDVLLFHNTGIQFRSYCHKKLPVPHGLEKIKFRSIQIEFSLVLETSILHQLLVHAHKVAFLIVSAISVAQACVNMVQDHGFR